MASVEIATPTNLLFDELPVRARRALVEQCELVDLTQGDILAEPGTQIRDVYFPTAGLISLVSVLQDPASLEVALIGNEGMLGIPLILGMDESPLRALVHASGGAWRMQGSTFRRVLMASPALRQRLDMYIHVVLAQFARTAACARFHLLEDRLAYWLLMIHDRSKSERIMMTHAVLADILGVRRSGVTTAAGGLQRRKLINYSRGGITIVDRKGLESASCSCYVAARYCYHQLLQ